MLAAAADLVEATEHAGHRDEARIGIAAAHVAAGDAESAADVARRAAATDGGALAVAVAVATGGLQGVARRPDPAAATRTLIRFGYEAAAAGVAGAALRCAVEVERRARVRHRGRPGALLGNLAAALAATGAAEDAVRLASSLAADGRDSALTRVAEALARGGDPAGANAAALLVESVDQRVWALVAVVEAGRAAEFRQVADEAATALIGVGDPATRAVARCRLARVLPAARSADLVALARADIAELEPGDRRARALVHLAAASGEGTAVPVPEGDRSATRLVDALVECGDLAAARRIAEGITTPAARARAWAALAAVDPDDLSAATALDRAAEASEHVPDDLERAKVRARLAVAAAAVADRRVDRDGRVDRDDGDPARREVVGLVADLLGTEAWHDVLPAVARLDPAAVRRAARMLTEQPEHLTSNLGQVPTDRGCAGS